MNEPVYFKLNTLAVRYNSTCGGVDMKQALFLITLALLSALLTGGPSICQSGDITVQLPDPDIEGSLTLEECLTARRSCREFGDRAMTLQEVSQILWAAQGITADWGARTAPSAGGLFPIRLFLAVENVDGLDNGAWEYLPDSHSLRQSVEGDLLQDLATAAVSQDWMATGSAMLVISAIPEITEARYRDRSMRYIDAEVGAICQNVYLMCETLGLGTTAVGAMNDEDAADIVGTSNTVRLLMPLGPIVEE